MVTMNEQLKLSIDIKVREDGEKLRKDLSILSVEDMLRPFTI